MKFDDFRPRCLWEPRVPNFPDSAQPIKSVDFIKEYRWNLAISSPGASVSLEYAELCLDYAWIMLDYVWIMRGQYNIAYLMEGLLKSEGPGIRYRS